MRTLGQDALSDLPKYPKEGTQNTDHTLPCYPQITREITDLLKRHPLRISADDLAVLPEISEQKFKQEKGAGSKSKPQIPHRRRK